MDTSDFDFIKGLLPHQPTQPPAGPHALLNCVSLENVLKGALDRVTADINADEKLPTGYAALHSDKSIQLKESIAAWESHGSAIEKARKHTPMFFTASGSMNIIRAALATLASAAVTRGEDA